MNVSKGSQLYYLKLAIGSLLVHYLFQLILLVYYFNGTLSFCSLVSLTKAGNQG